jgi:acyl carrier protein
MPAPGFVLQRLRRLATSTLNLNLSAEEEAALTRLDAVAGLDSLALLQLVAAVEKEFGIQLGPAELRSDLLADLPALAERLSARLGAAC